MKFIILISVLAINVFAQEKPELPSQSNRKILFEQIVANMNRVDGEGLIPRFNRSESWVTTTDKLKLEAANAKSLYELGTVFKRLDATYPNLHAKVYLHKSLDQFKTEGRLRFPFTIAPNLKTENAESYQYFINVDEKNKKLTDFQNGDELLAVNGIDIVKFEENNFVFCKFPFKNQCALELFGNLKAELLGWTRNQDLKFSIKRKNEILEVQIKSEVVAWDSNQEPEPEISCEKQAARYKDFELEFKGSNLCAYESAKKPGVLVLRIKSFAYDPDSSISSLNAEVDLFYSNFWRKKSASVKTVVFDVIGNYGGNSPIDYYGLFTQKDYQEQYAQFRKIKEFEEKAIVDSFFWGDKAKEIWFENLKKSGAFTQTPEGDFLPVVPQFCADQKKDCTEGLFKPMKHNFNGKIKIMMDQWCISSCVGFVDNISRLFKGRVEIYGHSDSGDSAYARVAVVGSVINGNVKTYLLPQKKARRPDSPEPMIRQVTSVSRSTDSRGNVLSGKPQKVNYWIPKKWNQEDNEWVRDVFRKTLSI